MIDWDVIAASLPEFAHGLKVCLLLLVLSVGTGFFLSIPLAVARVSSAADGRDRCAWTDALQESVSSRPHTALRCADGRRLSSGC